MRMNLSRLHGFISKQNKLTILLTAIVMIVAFGWLDYKTGTEISVSFFYLFPVTLAVLYLNLETSLAFTAASVIIWIVVDELGGESFSTQLIHYNPDNHAGRRES